jgi:hypothetical protein
VADGAAPRRELAARGVTTSEPGYVPATGRTNLNFRDPDGWRLQIVDARRKAPDPTATR